VFTSESEDFLLIPAGIELFGVKFLGSMRDLED
jgi:hypothetical protein